MSPRDMESLEKGLGVSQDDLSPQIPLGRYGEPIEVARTVLFLASKKSAYVTGGLFTVDGGQTASSRRLYWAEGATLSTFTNC